MVIMQFGRMKKSSLDLLFSSDFAGELYFVLTKMNIIEANRFSF